LNIKDYLDANLHLPEPLRSHEAQLQFTSFFYKPKNKDMAYLFENVSLVDLTYFTFEVYFKEMFMHGYKLSPVRLKAGFTGLSLHTIVQRLIEHDYINISACGATNEDYEKIVDGLVYSHNLDKYRKDGMYLPVEMRDFHFQKSMFKMLHGKYSTMTGNLSWIGAHVFITDFIHHYLAYSGLVLRRARNNFEFKDIEDEVGSFESFLRSKPFPLN
jgi:hypothetical protein